MKFIAYAGIVSSALKLAEKLLKNSKLVADSDLIKIEAIQDKVIITARDTLNFLKIYIIPEEITNEGTCYVNPSNLISILKTFDTELKVDFDLVKNYLIMRTPNGVYHNNTVEYTAEYSENQGEWVKIAEINFNEVHKFTDNLNKALIFVSDDDYRPAMNCVQLVIKDNEIQFKSTDAYTAFYNHLNIEKTYLSGQFLLDRTSCMLLSELNDPVEIYALNSNKDEFIELKVVTKRLEFKTEIIKEKFPDIDSILDQIEDENYKNIRIPNPDLKSLIKITLVTSNSTSKLIKMNVFKNELEMFGEDEESGLFSNNRTPAEYDGEEKAIGFNYEKMNDGLSVFKDDELIVKVHQQENKPIFITAENNSIKSLVMPVRL
jgi:DNA polymerase III sliding clamp (beta) subunit (PCNA family)